MTNDRLRLAVWCLGASVVTAVCIWVFVGAPPNQAVALWRSPVLNPAPR
ncbi:hypothetical protein [Bradyrhizobium guangdongense]|nr:hypothetical protein [Bradyrhizobium guangdongense]